MLADPRGRAPPPPRRRRLPAPAARRPHRGGRVHGLGGARGDRASWHARASRCRVTRPLRRAPAVRAPDQPRAALQRRRARQLRARGPARRALARTSGRWKREIRELLATIQQPHLRALLDAGASARTRSCGRTTAWRRPPSTTTRPTGTGCSSTRSAVAQAVSAISATFGGHRPRRRGHGRAAARHRQARGLQREQARRHRAHRRRAPARRDRARLLPHPAQIEDIDGLPRASSRRRSGTSSSPTTASLEHGSPVVPCTREATLVHMIDNLGGRLGSFDRLEKELAPGSRWSALRPRDRQRAPSSPPARRRSAGDGDRRGAGAAPSARKRA